MLGDGSKRFLDWDGWIRVSQPQIWVGWVIYANMSKISGVCLWTKLWENKLMDLDFFGLNPFRDIQWALPKYRTPQENSFFQLIEVRF